MLCTAEKAVHLEFSRWWTSRQKGSLAPISAVVMPIVILVLADTASGLAVKESWGVEIRMIVAFVCEDVAVILIDQREIYRHILSDCLDV